MALTGEIKVRMTEEMRAQLEVIAEAEERKASDIVRRAIKEYLQRRGELPPRSSPAPHKAATVIDKAVAAAKRKKRSPLS